MTLFQFLRFVRIDTPIIIYDIADIEICKVTSKEFIDLELFGYDILSVNVKKEDTDTSYLTIQLQK